MTVKLNKLPPAECDWCPAAASHVLIDNTWFRDYQVGRYCLAHRKKAKAIYLEKGMDGIDAVTHGHANIEEEEKA